MTPLETAAALAGPVGGLGGRFMLDPSTFARAPEIGLPAGFEYYAVGRFGVLGDVAANVIVASGVMFEPNLVESLWNSARPLAEPRAVAHHYATVCQDWGRQRLSGNDGLDRLAELLEKVVANAPVHGLPLFAGWQAVPRPTDGAGATYQLLHTLREYRFGCHAIAALAEVLSPLEAVLAGPGGEGNAAMFGWSEPYPEVTDDVRTRRAAAEARTDALAARAFEILDESERAELVERVTALQVS